MHGANRFTAVLATLSLATDAIFTTSVAPQRTLSSQPARDHGLRRYLWLQIEVILFRDRPIPATILFWIALHLVVIYGGLRLNIQ